MELTTEVTTDFYTEVHTISFSTLLDYLNDGKLVKLPHQRPLTLKKNSTKRFIDASLNNDLLVPFYLADLQSSYDCSTKNEDKTFFERYLNKGFQLSIEDCQHRLACLQSVTDDYFVGEFEGKKEKFLNTKVYVMILYNATKDELIRKFGKVNGGKTITNENLMWGIDNTFNNFIRSYFIDNENLIRLYKTKKKSESVERILYSNILKMLKICGSYDNLVNSPNTSTESMMTFIEDNIELEKFEGIINLFDIWYELIKDIKDKDSFTTQSNLFYLLHILSSKGGELDTNYILSTLSKLTNTRLKAEKRYEFILNMLENEE
jgi:hypothetical protein